MKGTRHSEEQIIAILKQGEAGLTTAELCRQQRDHGANLLPLEGEVRRDGQWGGETAEATGRRESEAEACCGRTDAG